MAGSFGYELDLNKLSREEKVTVAVQVKNYKKYQPLIHDGRYYRLTDPRKEHMSVWAFVSQDRAEVLVQGVVFRAGANTLRRRIRLAGLKEEDQYQLTENGKLYTGKALMSGGILLPSIKGDDAAVEIHFIRVSIR